MPYEKGFHFLYYLERLVGRQHFDKFIPHYFKTWARKSLDSFEFKETFLNFFNDYGNAEIKEKLAQIPWEERFYSPGLPPKPDFNTAYVDECMKLAKKWEDPVSSPLSPIRHLPSDTSQSYTPSLKDIESFSANQMIVFLQEIQKFSPKLNSERSHLLGSTYNISSSNNVEVKSAYYVIALDARDRAELPGVVELVGSVGRMKFVRPLYRKLNEVDRQLALDTFQKNRDFYPSTTRGQLEKDLGLR